MTSRPILKRLVGFILIPVLLVSPAVFSGCASKGGPKKKSGSVFAMPTWKKEQPKSKRPPKDPSTPVTVGEVLMLPRNDVL